MNYRDGYGDQDAQLTSREKKYAVKELPSFFEYCNYVFNIQSSVIGPSFEYKDWDDFLNLRGDFNKMRPFSNYPGAIKRYVEGLLCFVVSSVFSIYFPYDYVLEPSMANHSYPY